MISSQEIKEIEKLLDQKPGTAFIIIADKAVLEETTRSFTPEVRETPQKKLRELTDGLAKIHDATIKIDDQRGDPAVVNHNREVDVIMDVAREVFGSENTGMTKPNMVGEDFSYYLKKAPGAFLLCWSRRFK
ncbi:MULTISPECIES: M20/M25/M40 family metallo-hydrolase [unclassified Thermoactinomyces]|jgi:amidohydrolase|uniref:M20/M25/M40 family metallo-hydrolase n=1 Tax=unclassified Thermoactinomyces TaxID=2634588 RepID=UPI001E2E0BC3|nr:MULTISPECIES: M20/M25/M40 family metallo-hydrolase [unclassified Thermoactinomyces]